MKSARTPKVIVVSVLTGFQPSSCPFTFWCRSFSMLRHTAPSKLMLGWYSLEMHTTLGALMG